MATLRVWIDPKTKTYGFTEAETIAAIKNGFEHYFTKNANLQFDYTSNSPQVRVRSAELYFGNGVHGAGCRYGNNIWIHNGWLGHGHSSFVVSRWYRVFHSTQSIMSVVSHELGHILWGNSHSRSTNCLMHSGATAANLCASERKSLIYRYGEPVVPEPIEQQNPDNRFDVNNDGIVTPMDVLTLVNKLNEGESDPDSFYDVDGDGILSPNDVLNVINHLNAQEETDSVQPFRPTDD